MNGRPQHRLLAALIVVSAALVYGLWPSRFYSNDDLQYALIVTRASTAERLYHPSGSWPYLPAREAPPHASRLAPNARYILEWPTSLAAVRLWKTLGWRGDVIDPILSVRALAGALGLGLFFAALRKATARSGVALLATAGLATTVSYWTYSTHLDQSIVMTMWIAAALLLLVDPGWPQGRHGRYLAMIGALALASFYNLTAAITAVVFIGAISLRERDPAARLRHFLTMGTMYAAIVAAVVATFLVLNSRSIGDASYWRSAIFAGKPEYGVEPIRDLARAVIGVAKSQVLYPGVTGSLQEHWNDLSVRDRAVFGAYYLAVAAVMAAALLSLVLARRTMTRERRWLAGVVMAWFAAYFAFNWLWDPGYNKYWLLPLVAWWASASLLAAHVLDSDARRGSIAVAAMATLVAVSAGINLMTQFLPEGRVSRNPWIRIARTLDVSSPADALFASPAYHPLDFSIAFFGRRDVLTIGLLERNASGNRRQIEDIVSNHVRAHRAVGGPLYVYDIERLAPDDRAKFAELLGGGTLRPAWTFPEVTISELVP